MKNAVLILFFFGLITSCKQQDNQAPIQSNQSDSGTIVAPQANQDLTTDGEEIDLKKLRQEYIANYHKITTLDTSFTDKQGNQIHVQTKYYCLLDSAIHIPGHYVREDTTQGFVTHNYNHDIRIVVNNDTIFNETITKAVFDKELFPELKEYAVLFDNPYFYFDKEKQLFRFSYSISIPITDLGVGLSLLIDEQGNTSITN